MAPTMIQPSPKIIIIIIMILNQTFLFLINHLPTFCPKLIKTSLDSLSAPPPPPWPFDALEFNHLGSHFLASLCFRPKPRAPESPAPRPVYISTLATDPITRLRFRLHRSLPRSLPSAVSNFEQDFGALDSA